MSDQLLMSVAGARGIVGKTIDSDVITRLTLAFSTVLPPGPIVIGRDTRPSGESFQHSAMGAITGCGRDAIDTGIAATPTVEMVTEHTDAVGGIIVTASHNPVQWNALKFLDHRGIFISSEAGKKLGEVYETRSFRFADGGSCGHVRRYDTGTREHLDAIFALDVIDVARIRKRRFRVVLDCINGAGSIIAPDLLRELGCDVIEMDCTPDGNFHRDPEPRPDNLGGLAARVHEEGADLGFACDPDADRLALVDNNGVAISEEYTLALAADFVLSKQRASVVVNMSTSAVIDHVAALHDVPVHRTPVGEAHVVERMLGEGAFIGGEGNGGVIYPALHPGRDAILGMAFILQFLCEQSRTLSEQVAQYPPFVITKGKVALDGEFSLQRISGLLEAMRPASLDTQDGVKAVVAGGWIHLRVSNTEGLVRVITEAPDIATADRLQQQARDVLRASWRNASS